MYDSGLIFTAIMPIFFIILAGFIARRVGWLNEVADRSLTTVVVNLLYPAFIFSLVLGNEALREPANIVLPPLIGLTTIVAGFGGIMWLARQLKIGDPRECRTFAFSTGIYNYGYFPIPIIALLFNRETTGVLLVYNVGVEIAMWSLGVGYILSANDPKPIWRRLLSAPVIAILVAVPLNWLRVDQHLPNFAFESIDLLGKCAIPLALLLIGATFADLAKGVRIFDRLRIPITSVIIRLGIFPVILIFFAFLFPFPTELKAVMVVQAAMPCGVFPIVLARQFDGSPEVALKVVLATTIVSFVTIPLWISFGVRLLGL
ncbi:AEC family transporter [Coraliomargarita sp. SDUM461004]|uniref:AEC family transporter n=1 Tax=Thalassobacterium sedimentorum TaxID=3041258 RepID=A0ABU1AFE9_9BACT|nr:AEC family transporter [Coraliomargarita sp. SDUM461004]MDQ8193539.1 AEC family transporter [Coraliomargarita sp. SDUM461004]